MTGLGDGTYTEGPLAEIIEFANSPRAAREMGDVAQVDLPDNVAELVDDYCRLRGSRDPFIWKWVYRLTPKFTFPFVRDDRADDVREVKTVATLFLTLLDDVLEKERDVETFQEAAKIPYPYQRVDLEREGVDAEYISFAERVWETLASELAEAPRWEEYRDLFRHDLRQALDAIEFSHLGMREPRLLGPGELTRKTAHNMLMFAYADLDLSYAATTPGDDLALLREAVWEAQLMARIGNWLSTWERELGEHDYSSGVVVRALREGVVTYDDLDALESGPYPEETYDRLVGQIRAADVEEELLAEWQRHYEELTDVAAELETVDIEPYVRGMCDVLRYHLASEGMK